MNGDDEKWITFKVKYFTMSLFIRNILKQKVDGYERRLLSCAEDMSKRGLSVGTFSFTKPKYYKARIIRKELNNQYGLESY